jgi:TrpR-related protein YerC/YecD
MNKSQPTISQLKKRSAFLCRTMSVIDTSDDMFYFLRDLLTPDEMLEFSQRLDIAHKLSKGESYVQIQKETDTSSTTIARVSKFLQGQYGGYKKALSKKI